MTAETKPTLTDEEIETVWRNDSTVTATTVPQDADGGDGDAADGVDGDAADGRDGDAADGTDGDSGDADGQDA